MYNFTTIIEDDLKKFVPNENKTAYVKESLYII